MGGLPASFELTVITVTRVLSVIPCEDVVVGPRRSG
jgi:hypothetical protein